MFCSRAHSCESMLKYGQIVPIFKKGDRNLATNYRGVRLRAMPSRILARLLRTRLQNWSERQNILDNNPSGFPIKWSTGDSTQVIMRIQEDSADLKRKRRHLNLPDRSSDPEATLLDLKKHTPEHPNHHYGRF